MTRQELAVALGISASMVSRLVKRGMPTDDVARAQAWRRRRLEPGRVKGVRADTIQATGQNAASAAPPTLDNSSPAGAPAGEQDPAPPVVAPESGYHDARTRQAYADARMAELDLWEKEGALIRVDQVCAELAARLAPVREALLQLPARIAPVIAAQSDAGRIQTMLEAEVYQVLEPLAIERLAAGKLDRSRKRGAGA